MKTLQIFLILFSAIFISYTSCKTSSYTNKANKQFRTDSLIIDPREKDFINFMVRQPEDAFDEDLMYKMWNSANLRKSSTVEVIEVKDKSDFIKIIDKLACRVRIKNDTLIIRNGATGTDAGYGVETRIVNNKIFTRYYTYFASGPFYRDTLKFKIQKQTITLDKAKYSPRDSLFGSINTRMIDQNKIKYYVLGLFRTKVE